MKKPIHLKIKKYQKNNVMVDINPNTVSQLRESYRYINGRYYRDFELIEAALNIPNWFKNIKKEKRQS